LNGISTKMKRLSIILAVLLSPVVVRAQTNFAFNGQCQKGGQATVTQGLVSSGTQPLSGPPSSPGTGVMGSYPGCQIAVVLTGTTTPANIFSDVIGTPLANPFTGNTDGSFLFFASSGSAYDITLSGAGLPAPVTLTDVSLGGGGGGGGGGGLGFVAVTVPNGFGISGSPITPPGGVLNITTTGTPNLVQKAIAGGFGNSQITDDGINPTVSPLGFDVFTSGIYGFQVPNNAATGTTNNTTACDDGTGHAIICPHATSTTNVVAGFTASGGGTTGNARIAMLGWPTVTFDNQTTARHYAINSATVDGQLHDTGSTVPPAGQPFYFVWTANAGAGTAGQVRMLLANDFNNASPTAVYNLQVNGAALTPGDTVNLNATTPAAPANGYAITPATSKSGNTDSVSSVLIGDGNAVHCFLGTGVFASCPGSGGLVNPMTTLGDMIYENVTPAPARLAGPQTPNGIAQALLSIPSGGLATGPVWGLPGIVGRAITGTTATDTIATTDCGPKRVEYVGSVAVAVTLPTAATLAVPNCVFRLVNNLSSINDLTVTTTTWTCNGAATCVIHNGQIATVYVDPNSSTNWVADIAEQGITAGTGASLARGPLGVTINATGSGGSVTSVGLLGTTNQITVTGSSPITGSGSWTLSLPSTLVLPSGTTATTQATGDNTTSVATDAFVTTAIAQGNPAIAVLAASTANLTGTYLSVAAGIGDTFTVTATGAFTLDGIAINTIGQRVLLKDQTDQTQNGVYTATIVGALAVSPKFTRALDYDQPGDINYTAAIQVQSGTANALTSWLLTSQITSIGPAGSNITYSKFNNNPSAVVTSIATTSPITGGTITSTGTIACASCVTSSSPGVGIAHFAGSTQAVTSSLVNLTSATDVTGTLPQANLTPETLATGTSVSLSIPSEIYVCTGTCTVTPPVPAAGYQFCVLNDDNVATVITLAALGSSARYENTGRTAYGTAGTGTFVSNGAAGNFVCIVGRDSTHYLTTNFNGTWTAN
jgi:hypothetical protein